MEENEIYDFITICRDFVDSSKELRDAANLCDNDPIKQEMVAHIIPEFQQMWARSEGIKTLLEKKDFSLNKEFVVDEMKKIVKDNLTIADKIRKKLEGLK
tara:strand:+ start:179 stop:478 length:300 start_codon:yes stop_codon:yes gene_type:complete